MIVTIASPYRYEQDIRRSRFIAWCARADTPDDAREFIHRQALPDATHNAWAWAIGTEMRYSDDREVSGTAGKPILAAIQRQNLDRIVTLVSRYFGGIRLGTGGLVRAYGGTAAECLHNAPKQRLEKLARCRLLVPFELSGRAYPMLEALSARNVVKTAEMYTSNGIEFELLLQHAFLSELTGVITETLQGRGVITRLPDPPEPAAIA